MKFSKYYNNNTGDLGEEKMAQVVICLLNVEGVAKGRPVF
jgi:hypothetical protein